jgi:hypothetical protein
MSYASSIAVVAKVEVGDCHGNGKCHEWISQSSVEAPCATLAAQSGLAVINRRGVMPYKRYMEFTCPLHTPPLFSSLSSLSLP